VDKADYAARLKNAEKRFGTSKYKIIYREVFFFSRVFAQANVVIYKLIKAKNSHTQNVFHHSICSA
jgi:hypothetical protein